MSKNMQATITEEAAPQTLSLSSLDFGVDHQHALDHHTLSNSPWNRVGAKLAKAHSLFAATLPAHCEEHEGLTIAEGQPSHTPEQKADLLDSRFPLALLGSREQS